MLYVEMCKSKSGKIYPVLKANFGYRVAFVSFDTQTICDFLNCSARDLDYTEGKKYKVDLK